MERNGHDLVLLATDIVQIPNSDSPSLLHAAALDLDAQRWRTLANTESLAGGDRWFGVSGFAVNPSLSGADGGENQWGRSYPYGGIVEADGTWSKLPDPPSPEGGVTGFDGAGPDMALNEQGLVLEVPSMRWLTTPPLTQAPLDGRSVVVTDNSIFLWGGIDWSAEGTVSDRGWIWQIESEETDDSPSTTQTDPATTTTIAWPPGTGDPVHVEPGEGQAPLDGSLAAQLQREAETGWTPVWPLDDGTPAFGPTGFVRRMTPGDVTEVVDADLHLVGYWYYPNIFVDRATFEASDFDWREPIREVFGEDQRDVAADRIAEIEAAGGLREPFHIESAIHN
jgi:hypothetical protein